MILWHKKIEHPPGFVEKLEKQIVSQHDSKNYFTTYVDGLHKNEPILDEELDNHIKDFYREVVTEMMKDVGIHGYLDYETKDGDLRESYWVQMYNSETDSHFIHDHHGCGAFISWVHVLKALPTQKKAFFFANSRGQKLYPTHQSTSEMFAFPSWALHGVEQVTDVGVNRIIIAGNVYFKKQKPW